MMIMFGLVVKCVWGVNVSVCSCGCLFKCLLEGRRVAGSSFESRDRRVGQKIEHGNCGRDEF